jgi:hypothetical protein
MQEWVELFYPSPNTLPRMQYVYFNMKLKLRWACRVPACLAQ